MKTALAFVFVFLFMAVGGVYLNGTAQAYTEKRVRAVTLVDAWEQYDEYGERSLKGLVLDNKLGIEFTVSLWASQYQKFKADRQPQNLEVTTSLQNIRAPGVPEGRLVFSGLLIILGLVGAAGGFIAFIVGLLEWNEERNKAKRRLQRGW